MKTLILSIVMLCAFQFTQINAGNADLLKKNSLAEKVFFKDIKTVKLKITGIGCAGCTNTINNALKDVPGVISQKLEYPGDVATIKYDATITNPEKLIKIIEEAGFKAEILNEQKAEK